MAHASGTYEYDLKFNRPKWEQKQGNGITLFSSYKNVYNVGLFNVLSISKFKKNESAAPETQEMNTNIYNSVSLSSSTATRLYKDDVLILEELNDETERDYCLELSIGEYSIKYSLVQGSGNNGYDRSEYIINFYVVKYYDSTQKHSITDVVNRVLKLAEPLKATKVNGEWQCAEPRFRLNDEQAEKFSHIEAPEFVFTKCTLREMLQQVGSFIHAEPRLKNGVIYYDEYGGVDYVSDDIKALPYTQVTYRTNIENYCNKLDTSAENLINQIANKQGVVVEPYANGFKSVRAENLYSRIDEESLCIETKYPIYQIIKVECNWGGQAVDITPYIYEKSQYDTLTTDDGVYPYAKDYAIFYTQGQKNIYGLTHKSQHAVNSSFNNYSIKNILQMATGDTGLNIPASVKDNNGNFSASGYINLAFRVTYLPLYSARIETHKSCIGGKPRTRVYNQNDNIIETQYYGENLKGTIARMGNVDKSVTYYTKNSNQVPKCGQLWDDDYYVADVTCEYQNNYVKVQVSLSKDFNRLSEYIGIKSEKRCYEVSEKQAYKRDTVITNYVVFGNEINESNSRYPLLVRSPLFFIDGTIRGKVFNKITTVLTKTESGKEIVLPVISSAMGNSLLFTFSFADNYSAGMRALGQVNGQAGGYFAENTPYCDFYGRKEVLQFALCDKANGNIDVAKSLPVVDGLFIPSHQYITTGFENDAIYYSKDSREIPQITVEIAYVSTDSSYVIGSALARGCSLITNSNAGRKVYFSTRRINKFSQKVDTTEMTQGQVSVNSSNFDIRNYFDVSCDSNQNFKSWLIVDDNDNLLLGRNINSSNDRCYMSMVSKV